MTAVSKADEIVMTIIANSLAHTNIDDVCAHVDQQIDAWIAADEAAALEALIVAYSTISDVIGHINTRLEVLDGR